MLSFRKLIYVVLASCLLKVQLECCFYKLLSTVCRFWVCQCMRGCADMWVVFFFFWWAADENKSRQFGSHCGNFSSGVTPNSVSAFGFGVDLSFSFTILPVSLHFPGHIAVDFGP